MQCYLTEQPRSPSIRISQSLQGRVVEKARVAAPSLPARGLKLRRGLLLLLGGRCSTPSAPTAAGGTFLTPLLPTSPSSAICIITCMPPPAAAACKQQQRQAGRCERGKELLHELRTESKRHAPCNCLTAQTPRSYREGHSWGSMATAAQLASLTSGPAGGGSSMLAVRASLHQRYSTLSLLEGSMPLLCNMLARRLGLRSRLPGVLVPLSWVAVEGAALQAGGRQAGSLTYLTCTNSCTVCMHVYALCSM